MEEIGCMCSGLPVHSHVYRSTIDPAKTAQDPVFRIRHELDPYDVRIWVDWKAVARDYALDERVDRTHGPGAAAAIAKAYDDGSLFSDGGS